MSILDRIDATLAAAADRCPCGTPLHPDSPSLDWCSDGCQWTWAQDAAHEPGDVYGRPDAGDVLPAAPVRWGTITLRFTEEQLEHALRRWQAETAARNESRRFRITGV